LLLAASEFEPGVNAKGEAVKWKSVTTQLSQGVTHFKFVDEANSHGMTFAEVAGLWMVGSDEGRAFRGFTAETLAECPFQAFRWETPPVNDSNFDRLFEFVLVDSPSLDRPQSERQFRDQFGANTDDETVIVFPNIGRNAILVVPCPLVGPNQRAENDRNASEEFQFNYCHLSSFLRSGPPTQIDRFWIQVSTALHSRLSAKPVWLSTAGGGVPWLHVRMDDSPKYYAHKPFKTN
jgi:hypothetical protein